MKCQKDLGGARVCLCGYNMLSTFVICLENPLQLICEDTPSINKAACFFSLKKSGDFHCGEQGPRLHWAKYFEDQGAEGQNSSHDLDLDFSLDGGL